MKPIDIHLLFPKVIAKTSITLPQEESKLLNDVYDKTTFVPTKPDIKDEVSMSGSLNILSDLEFLKHKITDTFNSFKNNFLMLKNTKFKVTTSWFTLSKSNETNSFHKHSNNDYSLVYYFGNSDKVKITFEDFNPGHNRELVPVEELDHNVVSKTFELQNNDLIIFPSEVYHKIESFDGDNIRKSLAINFTAIGEFGFGDSKINVK
tara:strand:- start:61 stop:678 length:618 start_codon:yes stop_codon:yes gene_type:complete